MKTMARGNCREVGPGPAGPRTNPPVTSALGNSVGNASTVNLGRVSLA